MASPRAKQDLAAAKAAAKVKANWVVFLVDAPMPRDMAAKCRPGVNWIRLSGQRTLVVKHINGLAYVVSWTLPAPPERLCETEGLRLLDEAVAGRDELIVIGDGLKSEQAEKARIARLWERYQEGGVNALSLKELRDLGRARGVDVEQIERNAREKVARDRAARTAADDPVAPDAVNPDTKPEPGPDAGDAPEEN